MVEMVVLRWRCFALCLMALDVEVLHLERLATLKNVVALLLGVTSETVMAELLLG